MARTSAQAKQKENIWPVTRNKSLCETDDSMRVSINSAKGRPATLLLQLLCCRQDLSSGHQRWIAPTQRERRMQRLHLHSRHLQRQSLLVPIAILQTARIYTSAHARMPGNPIICRARADVSKEAAWLYTEAPHLPEPNDLNSSMWQVTPLDKPNVSICVAP
ncbi:hypothetical protein AC579_502 [Pseudocercospora musae]|uniref:Uncharacterized protein n=1 Tax=Pseudocercospora musae TaxID=113226 RepID=A0A139I623_9PEZI|nr:hypothetical protein AC579_502 [Pseudocercospora musae]